MNRLLMIILFSYFITGCVASGAYYSGLKHKPAGERAKVIFLRTSESKLYFVRSAPLYANNKKCFSLPINGFSALYLEPGDYQFMTRNFDALGECLLEAQLEKGQEYFIEIKPNSKQALSLMLGAAATSAAINNKYPFYPGFYSNVENCRGMFMFSPVNQSEINAKTANLRMVDTKSDECL